MHSLIATESVASGECIFSYSALSGKTYMMKFDPSSLLSYRNCTAFSRLLRRLRRALLQDYQRAERFLPGNVRHLVSVADVSPHWIEKTNRFWYRRVGLKRHPVHPGRRGDRIPAVPHSITIRLATRFPTPRSRDYSASACPFQNSSLWRTGRQFASPSRYGSSGLVRLATLRLPSKSSEAAHSGERPNEVALSEQALGCVTSGTQPLPARCFDRRPCCN